MVPQPLLALSPLPLLFAATLTSKNSYSYFSLLLEISSTLLLIPSFTFLLLLVYFLSLSFQYFLQTRWLCCVLDSYFLQKRWLCCVLEKAKSTGIEIWRIKTRLFRLPAS